RLHRELVDARALGEALLGCDYDDLFVRDGARADDAVVALELDRTHASRATAGGPHVSLGEADALTVRGHDQQLVVVPAREDRDDAVVVGNLHRDDAALAARRLGKLGDRGALHRAR